MELLNSIINYLVEVMVYLISLLPESPIQENVTKLEGIEQVFKYLNWFVPVGEMVKIMTAVCAATMVWYAVRWIMRFSRYI